MGFHACHPAIHITNTLSDLCFLPLRSTSQQSGYISGQAQHPLSFELREPEPDVVVTVVRRVPVAVSGAHVLPVVDPRATTQNTVL